MKDEVLNICQDFIDLVDIGKKESVEGNENYLQMYLNMLPNFVKKVEYCSEFLNAPDTPSLNYNSIREKVEKRFPNYGLYNSVECITEIIGEADVTIGDAIDDIADIYIDLSSVMWLMNEGSPDAAIDQFNESFDIHWGMHCRELQLYLHSLPKDM